MNTNEKLQKQPSRGQYVDLRGTFWPDPCTFAFIRGSRVFCFWPTSLLLCLRSTSLAHRCVSKRFLIGGMTGISFAPLYDENQQLKDRMWSVMRLFRMSLFEFMVMMISVLAAGRGGGAGDDPLASDSTVAPRVLDLDAIDRARQRTIPLRVYLPAAATSSPVVLFSHGLGGSRQGNVYLAQHWSKRGYVVVMVQHPGSDDSVWKSQPALRRIAAMRKAANADNFIARVKDISAVLDELERWSRLPNHPLSGRLDTTRIGMSGHSFGARTTQAVSGQRLLSGKVSYTDPRIRAAVMFSPSAPQRENASDAFGHVSIPWLLMTGTKDVAPIGDADVASRLAVFPALPPGNKYELVLDGAQHSAFTDHPLPGDKEGRNPNHHRAILAISTAFWDAYLKGDREARAWLDGNGPRSVLEQSDRWQRK